MKLLVTGGAGFIGSAVVRRAIAQGHQVVNLDAMTYAACADNVASVAQMHDGTLLQNHRIIPALTVVDGKLLFSREIGVLNPHVVLTPS